MIRRLLPLFLLLLLMGIALFNGWHRYLSLEYIALNYSQLKAFIADHSILSLLAFGALYAVVTALSLPVGVVLTVAGGLLFGWFWGALATVTGATIGAGVIFLIAKTSLGDQLVQKAGNMVGKLRDGFQENAFSYLLFLRLVPAFPFWLVNLAPALLGMRFWPYMVGTFLGIIPGTVAFSIAGNGLDSVIEKQKAPYDACLEKAANAADCSLSIDTSQLVTKELIIAFIALGVVSLIPVFVKKFKKEKGAVANG